MIRHPAFPVDAWCLRETHLDLDMLAQTESLFALSNGHLGWRGNLDEGEPSGLPGSYLNGCHERRPIPYPEFGYGLPDYSQTVINVTNGKLIRLLVGDEPFDVRSGHLRSHERALDFRTGTLARVADWVSPAGRAVRVRSTRLVSLTHRAIAAICYEVAPLDARAEFVLQSELVANERLPGEASGSADPRSGTVLQSALHGEAHAAHDRSALLVHRTRLSNLRVAAAMAHVIAGPPGTDHEMDSSPDVARLTVSATLAPGQALRLVKLVGYGWSSATSPRALRDRVEAALTAAAQAGWPSLLDQQRAFLGDFWRRADVQLDGDPELQQAIRFGLFHVLQAGARAEAQAIPAKGLTGPGYDGHAFWDTEMFVLPMLTFTYPEAAADELRWRYSTLAKARARARQLGLRGAAFPWRTIDGAECSGYWPAGTGAFHVNADIADAVIRYVDVTGDARFEASPGLELLVETARLWRSLGHHASGGEFRIDGVTGPDEYSAVADNNVYTNLMAQHNLRAAADAAQRHPAEAGALAVSSAEIAAWRRAADAMTIPYDDELGIHPQSEGFTGHEVWDFAGTSAEQYPLLRHFPYFDLYRKQVVKQADLVLAMQQRPDAFSEAQKARNFAYYERLTVRDSSLSAATQSVMAAEVSQLELAYDYLAESALIDLDDTELNVADGLHLAALAGAWTAVVAGLGGLRSRYGTLIFAPRLPAPITRLAFTIGFRGQPLRTEITAATATYELAAGAPAVIRHHGREVTLTAGEPVTLEIPPITRPERLSQPPGREPRRRSEHAASQPDRGLAVLVVQDGRGAEPAARKVG
jgi:alpha,alpha-trehalose phosphorylase